MIAQDGRLNLVHARVEAKLQVVVALLRPVVAIQAQAARQLGVSGDDGATFAVRAEVLGVIEAEAAHVADRAGAAALVFGTMRLAASSTTSRSWRAAMSMIGSMSAICPYRCTGMMAFVRGVTCCLDLGDVDQKVRGSIST